MRWWAEEAAGLPAPLDQFGVSHTSQRGYLPFSEVQREDKMKESSHLIKGKRKKRHGHQAYKTGLKGAMLPSPPTLSYSHFFIHLLRHSQQTLMFTKLCVKPIRRTRMKKHGMFPAPKELTIWLGH